MAAVVGTGQKERPKVALRILNRLSAVPFERYRAATYEDDSPSLRRDFRLFGVRMHRGCSNLDMLDVRLLELLHTVVVRRYFDRHFCWATVEVNSSLRQSHNVPQPYADKSRMLDIQDPPSSPRPRAYHRTGAPFPYSQITNHDH